MTTERPTAASYREMARKMIECAEDDMRTTDDDTYREIAAALRCAAEDAEKMQEMREAMQEFVDRVDAGEVCSTYTVGKFKRILGGTDR